jgi:hypothetical protein
MISGQKFGHHGAQLALKIFDRIGLGNKADITGG